MRILKESEEQDALKWLDEAARVAKGSLCDRAHCGSVIVKDGAIVAEGFNSPPQNDGALRTCLNEYEIPAGFRHDRTCCIHAEQRAIQSAHKAGKDMSGAKIYFVAVDEAGNKVKATDMKCTICSRAVVDAGMAEFIFYAAEGVRSYDPAEVDALSYEYKTPLKK
jgi:deoxycytidylate deaminase